MFMKTFIISLPLSFAFMVGMDKLPEAQDVDKIQGHWIVVFYEEEGFAAPRDVWKNWKFEFADGTVVSKYSDGSIIRGTYHVNDSKDPREIDLIWREPDAEPKKIPGIYKIEGGKLTICIGTDSQKRPSRFALRHDSDMCLIRLSGTRNGKGKRGHN